MKAYSAVSLFLLGVAAVPSCTGSGGTETGNPATPLQDFTSSACKNRDSGGGQLALVKQSDADGLQCVEWEQAEDGSLNVRLINFPEPCGETYLGSATRAEDGSLDLSVHKDTCAVYKCGLCIFDFEFQLAGVATDVPVSLRLGSAACATEPITYSDTVTLPLDSEASGIVCRGLEPSALGWYAQERGSCGQRNMPCGDCAGLDTSTCAADLVCSKQATNDSRCLLPCETSDDCTDGLTTCEEGVCRAPADW